MLAIPSLGRVPRTFTVPRASIPAARTALALLEAGLLNETAPRTSPAELVKQGLDTWLDRHAGKLRMFNVALRYDDGDLRVYRDEEAEPKEKAVMLSMFSTNWDAPLIGERVKDCERAITGLGETILYWLNRASAHVPVWTPSSALNAACWCYWQGCNDERERIEEMKLNDEAGAIPDLFTRAQFDSAIPTWASSPRERIKREGIEHLASPRRTTVTGKVSRALLKLIATMKHAAVFEAPDDPPLGPYALMLRWSKDDPMTRIWDDASNDLAESGEYREWITQSCIPLDDDFDAQLAETLRAIEPWFAVALALEELIALIVPRPQTIAEVFRGY